MRKIRFIDSVVLGICIKMFNAPTKKNALKPLYAAECDDGDSGVVVVMNVEKIGLPPSRTISRID